jgi:L-lactate dehydrogenase (cytochrome)
MSIYDVNPVSVKDYQQRARRRLPKFLYDYLEGGANEELSAELNVSDFHQYRLRQRVMRDVSQVNTSTTIMGEDCKLPLVLAPVGMAGMFSRRGEVLGAQAALESGVPFTASTVGICPVEEIQAATGQPFWFQLYMLRDRSLVEAMLERASQAGCTTLVFTVDLAVPGMRLRDFRNGMLSSSVRSTLSKGLQLATSPFWVADVALQGKPLNFGNLARHVSDPSDLNAFKEFVDAQFDPTVTWEDIAWLRSIWKGKLLIKGVLEPDDARAAVNAGADGVVVSNHGGRQLDSVASSISKLPAIAEAVGKNAEVLMDGGIRSGIDIVKALGLGADGVLIGRPWIYAAAAAGQQGITDLLTVFQQEVAVAMALMGVNRIEEITADLIES